MINALLSQLQNVLPKCSDDRIIRAVKAVANGEGERISREARMIIRTDYYAGREHKRWIKMDTAYI